MAKARSKTAEGNAAQYKTSQTWKVNRTKRLERDLKNNPSNEKQIMDALGNMVYRRKTPTNPFWSSTRRNQARLFKLFTGRVNIAMFSNNEKLANEALLARSNLKVPAGLVYNHKTAFNIGTRITK